MRIRRAVILAAGTGSRLGTLTACRPEPRLEIAGRTILDWQIEALESCGVRETTVVVGDRDETLMERLGNRVSFMHNERCREANGLYSLWLATERLKGGTFVVDGNIVFSPALLELLNWHPAPDALLFDPGHTVASERVKVRLAGPYVVDMRTHIPPALASGEVLGLLKFGSDGALRLGDVLERSVAAGKVDARATDAVVELAHRWPVVAIAARGLPWTVIESPEDLAYANEVIAPAVNASLPPEKLRGRRRG